MPFITLGPVQVKTTDEGEYRVVIENEHGKDEKSFMLYVSGGIVPNMAVSFSST
jgi:hypothetical protein